jgi:hypothetical protein
MPYRSKAQRAYLHIHNPALAKKWDAEYGGKIAPKKKPKKRKPAGRKK